MQISLLTHTPSPQKTVAYSAKLCYSGGDIATLTDGVTEEVAAKFVDMLSEIGHESPIEHVSFTFGIEGVSRSLLAQLTRHRLASYSVQSQRYVQEGSFEFVIPPEINCIPEAKEVFLKSMEQDQDAYNALTLLLSEKRCDELLKNGMDEKAAKKEAKKKAIEDARFVLPNACTTKLICTMNARELHNFFSNRCCNRAQWEIRELAYKMLVEVKKVAPQLFKKAGPPCIKGPCPEGKMNCGKMNEVREMYR